MQQSLAHISPTLFEREIFYLRQNGTQARVAHVMIAMATVFDNCFLNFCPNVQNGKNKLMFYTFNHKLSISNIYKVGMLFCFLWTLL
jgi:hypothetical protein